MLKLNGKSPAGGKEHGIDSDTVLKICAPIKARADLGVQAGIVVGGGNFWRGCSSGEMDRTRVGHMGMLAVVINALGVADAPEQLGAPIRVQTATTMQQVTESYICNCAARRLEKGRVAVFGCGIGNPFLSIGTAASLRAAEIDVDIIMKATLVDGVYDSDPKLNETAVKFDPLSFMDALNKDLHVMDNMVATLCKDNDILILVFSIVDPENTLRAVYGEPVGMLVE